MTNNNFALIMAGGAGTRLWPLSREQWPKPVLPLVDSKHSMFQISVERLQPLFPPERILVIANPILNAQLREQAPQIPLENFIDEPEGRDTAPAVGLGAIHIQRRNPDAVMAVLTADHFISDVARFRQLLEVACQSAAGGDIVTLGITPDYPATGFGYIERGNLIRALAGTDIYSLSRFVEKPDQQRAEEFLRSGRYSWNSGMFIWSVRRLLEEFAAYAPDISAILSQLSSTINAPGYNRLLTESWESMPKISVDYALMEHIHERSLVIPVDIGWNDIGNFEALYDILSKDQDQHATVSPANPIHLDSQRILVMSKRLVATIGLEDLVIVDTDDVLLVCPRNRSQDVKQLVEIIKQRQQNEYL
jgi:mannose-1-phosphate guanylyltransferase